MAITNPIRIIPLEERAIILSDLQKMFENSKHLKDVKLKNEDDLILYPRLESNLDDLSINATIDVAEDSTFYLGKFEMSKSSLKLIKQMPRFNNNISKIDFELITKSYTSVGYFLLIEGGSPINNFERRVFFAFVLAIANLVKGYIMFDFNAIGPTHRWLSINRGIYKSEDFEKIANDIIHP